jgi:GT2 family glycosyltransferase
MDTELSFEIIVVEETDNPVPIEGTIYIPHPVANRGIPYARNLALAHAGGDIIVFLDDDCIIHSNWLETLLAPFQDKSVVGVQGGINVPKDTNVIGWVETILGFPGGGIRRVLESEGRNQETREISTLNCAYRRWVIDKIGGFEKKLKITGEDYILAKKACEYGKCLFVPDAMVSHEARGDLKKIWSWFVRRGRAEVDVIRTGAQKDITLRTVLKGSLVVKFCILTIIILLFFIYFSCWPILLFLTIAVLLFHAIQFTRYYKAWKISAAPLMTLLLLPGIKLWMDTAMDWGRLRGFLFD